MTADLDLMQLQVETLFTHDPDGRMRWLNEPGETLAPRFFLGRTRDGNLWRSRYDLPDDVVRALDGLAAAEPVAADLRAKPSNFEAFRAILHVHTESQGIWMGPAYRFPDLVERPANVTMISAADAELLRRFSLDLAEADGVLGRGQPCAAVVEQGVAVSLCFSARITARAAEAGVETLQGYRGRGYATAAVAGWAIAVRALGRVPLYSTSWENLASQGVARKLGLVLYGADLSFT